MVREKEPGFTLADIQENDPAVMAMLGEGKTSGVFQMESAGMTGVCVGLKPQTIEDITAIIALYRPGPMDSIPGSSPASRTRERSPISTRPSSPSCPTPMGASSIRSRCSRSSSSWRATPWDRPTWSAGP